MGSALSLSARNKSNEYIYKEECQILLPNKQKMSHKNIFKIPSLHKFHKTIESNDILTMQNKLHSINKAEVLRDKSFKLVDRIQCKVVDYQTYYLQINRLIFLKYTFYWIFKLKKTFIKLLNYEQNKSKNY